LKQGKCYFLLFIVGYCGFTHAQNRDTSILKKELTPGFLSGSADSLSLFQLIDSLLAITPLKESGSLITTRVGYSSNIMATSRLAGLSQFGITPGVSYFHKSGLYIDVSGYYSQEYKPSFYLTIGSLGYLKTYKKWTLMTEYSRYMYTPSDSSYTPYKNNFGLTNYFNIKPFIFRLDYLFYFGDKSAHRITPSVAINLVKSNWKGIRKIQFYPTFSLMTGLEDVQTIINTYQLYTKDPALISYRIKHNLPLYYLNSDIQTKSQFGVMNYTITLPLNISWKNWSFLASYVYNFTHALPGETVGSNSGYFSFGITRYFQFSHQGKFTF